MAAFQINSRILSTIENQVDQLAEDYISIQGLILTEDDLKCLLYSRLSRMPLLRGPSDTRDPGIQATKVHSEVSWFDTNGKLTIRPDLTILDPAGLRILQGDARRIHLPSKEYGYNGNAIVLELKFIRQKSGITNSVYRKQIERDWKKIRGLFRKLNDQKSADKLFCFFVIFNKGRGMCPESRRFLRANRYGDSHRILYKSGEVF